MASHFPEHGYTTFYSPSASVIEATPGLQSPHGAEVEKLIQGIVEKWKDVEERAALPDINDVEYNPVRARRIVKFKGRLVLRAKGRALPFELNDTEEE